MNLVEPDFPGKRTKSQNHNNKNASRRNKTYPTRKPGETGKEKTK